jgi:hypothetical protein
MIGGRIGQIFNLSTSETGNFLGDRISASPDISALRRIGLGYSADLARKTRLGPLSARSPLSVARSFVRGVADATVSSRRFDLIGKPRPNLGHLQHDRLGLFIHGGSRDF